MRGVIGSVWKFLKDSSEAVHWLALFFAAGILLGWLRVGQAVVSQALLDAYAGWPLSLYLVVSGGLWGTAGLPALWALIFQPARARQVIWAAALFYPLSYWLDRLLVGRSEEARTGYPFMAAASLAWLLFCYFTLRRKKPRGEVVEK